MRPSYTNPTKPRGNRSRTPPPQARAKRCAPRPEDAPVPVGSTPSASEAKRAHPRGAPVPVGSTPSASEAMRARAPAQRCAPTPFATRPPRNPGKRPFPPIKRERGDARPRPRSPQPGRDRARPLTFPRRISWHGQQARGSLPPPRDSAVHEKRGRRARVSTMAHPPLCSCGTRTDRAPGAGAPGPSDQDCTQLSSSRSAARSTPAGGRRQGTPSGPRCPRAGGRRRSTSTQRRRRA